ncbi:protein WVD2-like 7 isoform X2 [Rhodamnia argentea]|uniref:Protein WVD2-like 7 isoform X2 n=1 Tax=Rhodamnia argentea TaxID=178133 RepID=A0A8B8PAR0_9MYRT|nr:protein WVD2-like 7 isoform X2 [Rhodamnia argentea]
MGDSTCFMQPFSYASGLPGEQSEGNPIHALQQSISFGRFVTDSVSWDKWSVSSHNRYVEEAEKFSRPGSVAQKKAFFEAHYKEIAARKAAALLEQQANAALADAAKPRCEVGLRNPTCYEFPAGVSSSQTILGESREVQEDNNKAGSAIEGSEIVWNVEVKETRVIEEIKEVNRSKEDEGADLVTEAQVDANDYVAEQLLGQLEDVDGRKEVNEIEQSWTLEMEKPLLKNDEADLATEAQVHITGYVAEELSGQLENVYNHEEVMEIEQSGTPEMEKPLLKNSADQGVLVSKKKSAGFSLKSVVCLQASSSPSTPVKSTTTALSWKERGATPTGSKSKQDCMYRTRTTPKQLLHGNLTPVRELKRRTPTFPGKTASSRIGVNSYKLNKECQTPLKTPTMVHANRVLKHSLVTPQSANRRTPRDGSAVETLNTGPKRRSLARDCSKFLSACKNKLQSPSLSTPFRLRTEERAARRKEKLEEKFNADEKEKVQLQKKVKEKAESEMRKFRQSFCFKARPLPDFYKEKTMPPGDGHMKKPPGACPQTPKSGKKPTTTTTAVQSTSFQPCQRPLFDSNNNNNNVSKQVQGKNHRLLFPKPSRSALIAHENRSPNIQLA